MPPLAILIPVLAPVVTELIKWLAERLITQVPPMVVPLISAAVGGLGTVLAQQAGLDPGVDVATGTALGLSGTGVHQLQQLWRTRPDV